MKAHVYLNNGDGHYFGFESAHVKDLVCAAVLDVPTDRHQLSVLDDLFTEFNVGGTYLDAADDYRARGNRSLSVGDVICFEVPNGSTVAFACASAGWEPVNPQFFSI